MKKYLILTLLILAFLENVVSQQGIVKGRVFNVKNNEPLPFANIIIWETNIGSTSDFDGNFIFTGVKPGFVRLAVSLIGFETYVSEESQVTNSKTIFIEIGLKETQIKLNDVEIKASPFRKVEESPVSLRTLGISEIEKNPGGNRDISKVIQSLPGISSSVSFRNDLIVRGGGPSENSFYLDGVEIPTLNHFSTQGASGGPVGIINVDFLREVDVYSGAFPASRGNALSSIIEMKQLDGNKENLNSRASLGATDIALTLDGPLNDKTTFIFSARRSYLQFLFDLIGLPFLPTYNDVQFKIKNKLDLKNEITLIGLGALDEFKLNTGLENPDESQRYILGYLPVNEQWSYTIGGIYKHYQNNGFYTLVISRNYLNNRAYKYFNNDESNEANKNFDYISEEIENKIRFERMLRSGSYKFIYGLGGAVAKYTNKTYQKIFSNNTLSIKDYKSNLDFAKWNIFGQISRDLLDKRLIISIGARMDANNYSNSMSNLLNQFSPRFSASYYLTDKLTINLNTGRYFQHPGYTTLGYRNNEGILSNKRNNLKYITSDHLVAGIEFLPNRNSKISIEGFYKWYKDYPFSVNDSISLANKGGDFGIVGDEEVVSISDGKAYGFEILARDRMFRSFNIILSYTYVISVFRDLNNRFIPSAWDNTHIINLTFSREFRKNWFVGLKWRYVGGAPYTPYDTIKSSSVLAWNVQGQPYLDFNKYNSLRLKSYHQLDIRIDKQYFFKNWALLFYLDIQNFYNFKYQGPEFLTNLDENGETVIINPNMPIADQKYELRPLPNESGTILPSLGIIVEF
ncbi:TonB-dependent receptor domain-containing protein [Bacteroidota bacterium]